MMQKQAAIRLSSLREDTSISPNPVRVILEFAQFRFERNDPGNNQFDDLHIVFNLLGFMYDVTDGSHGGIKQLVRR
ncbi:unnamed protein product [Somion occarium]|uniref:Uncharacterized protein n=1 Tax=Somion occarium TaxID=3059160 RepID=A0ABP1CKX7_9APHY